MKRVSTLFLKIAVILIGIPILALCIFVVPEIGNTAAKLLPEFPYIKYLVSFVFYASAIPFYFALYQAFKLLRYIDKNEAFSQISVKALKKSNTVPLPSVPCICQSCRSSISLRRKTTLQVSFLSDWLFLLLRWISQSLLLFSKGF